MAPLSDRDACLGRLPRRGPPALVLIHRATRRPSSARPIANLSLVVEDRAESIERPVAVPSTRCDIAVDGVPDLLARGFDIEGVVAGVDGRLVLP